MIEPLAMRFVEYKKRKQVVIILTILSALVVVWPAVDEYTAASQRQDAAQVELDKAQEAVKKLDQYVDLHARKQQELASLEQQMMSEKAAQSLKGQLTDLGQQTGCMIRRARLDPPARRDWKEKDHPIKGTRRVENGGATPFKLETRRLALSVTGPMPSLYNLLEQLHRIEKVVHSQAVEIKRSSEDGNAASLTMEFLLFDLPLKLAKS